VFGCTSLTEPVSDRKALEGLSAAPAAPTPGTGTAAPTQPANAVAPPSAPTERVSTAHILLAYEGARRSRATRSKDEARKLAEQLRDRARKGEDFATLARTHSDDATSKPRGGSIGPTERSALVPPYANAAFALKPSEISDVVETEFGFHVIKRE
jgi:parvulin-like peptidyl-prolyl isomerase